MRIPTDKALGELFNGNGAAMGRFFGVSRVSVSKWRAEGFLPELRAMQLVERLPGARRLIVEEGSQEPEAHVGP